MWSDEEELGEFDPEGWDTAQVCTNGHMISICSVRYSKYNQEHCDRCGAATITTCPHCGADIRGLPFTTNILGGGSGRDNMPPNFCHNCGKPYPWTEGTLEAARELADDLEGVSAEEKEKLKQGLNDLVADTPRTALAATRWKRALSKTGQAAISCFENVMSGILVEAAKRQLFG